MIIFICIVIVSIIIVFLYGAMKNSSRLSRMEEELERDDTNGKTL